MNITIMGAGNIGTQFAAHCAEKGHRVTVFSSKPEKINKKLSIINEKNEIIHQGVIDKSTNDPVIEFTDAEEIFVIMPATLMKANAAKILPFVKPGMKICIVPGTGGGVCGGIWEGYQQCMQPVRRIREEAGGAILLPYVRV